MSLYTFRAFNHKISMEGPFNGPYELIPKGSEPEVATSPNITSGNITLDTTSLPGAVRFQFTGTSVAGDSWINLFYVNSSIPSGTPALVYDGVTDNYSTIMNALAEYGVCVIPAALGQVAVSAPILLDLFQGLQAYSSFTPSGGVQIAQPRLVPTPSGFNPNLTAAQQANFPALGPTVSAPLVFAGAEAWCKGVCVSGETIAQSAVIVGAGQAGISNCAFQYGLGTTFLDNGSGQQGTLDGVTIRGGGNTSLGVIDIESADWIITNLRATAGSHIFNGGGMMLAGAHLTGVTTGVSYNTLISSPCTMSNVYIDSGNPTDLIQVNLRNGSDSATLQGIRIANNSAGTIPNIFNDLSTGTGGLLVQGLDMASSSHNFGSLLANARSSDMLQGIHLNSAHLVSTALTALFPNGTPGYYDVVTY